MDLEKIGREGMSWIRVGQDETQGRAVINTVMSIRVDKG
jgi:hypothetical protein